MIFPLCLLPTFDILTKSNICVIIHMKIILGGIYNEKDYLQKDL